VTRIIALLSWYDEEPRLLSRVVASLCGVVDHVVAIDGPYMLYPGASQWPQSEADQRAALIAAADGARLGITLVSARRPWYDGEVEKRTALFDYGRLEADDGDWFFCVDADEYVMRAPGDLRDRLTVATADGLEVAGISVRQRTALEERQPGEQAGQFSGHRVLFKALPDLRVEVAHYFYLAGPEDDPRVLRGRFDIHDLEPSLDVPDLVIAHTPSARPMHRDLTKRRYYERRDELMIERPVIGAKLERVDGGQSLFNGRGERERVLGDE
jgi:hypothetical protein